MQEYLFRINLYFSSVVTFQNHLRNIKGLFFCDFCKKPNMYYFTATCPFMMMYHVLGMVLIDAQIAWQNEMRGIAVQKYAL